MSRQEDNLKTLERLSDGIPPGEKLRFYYTVVLEMAKVLGVRRFFIAVRSVRSKHGL